MSKRHPTDALRKRSRTAGCLVLFVLGAILFFFLQSLGLRSSGVDEIGGIPDSLGDQQGVTNQSPLPREVAGKLLPTPTYARLKNELVVPESIIQQPVPERASRDLEALYSVVVPVHDYFSTAEALRGVDLGPRQISRESYQLGERALFNTADGSRQAQLVYIDDLAYYWVELGLNLDHDSIAESAERLRLNYYPILTKMFGQVWRPGVDGDNRFSIFHILGSEGDYELGYFIDENAYPVSLFAKSNEQEMVYLNMSRLEPGTPIYDGTLVHEIQHLIQWNMDANEDTWLNEGLSQLAETLVGLDTVSTKPYMEKADIRLDRWTTDPPDVYAHYAAAYLYLLYLWEQAGDAAIQELARHPANGLAAVRSILAGYKPGLSLETFTGDWAVANYLDGNSTDSRYSYRTLDLDPPFDARRVRDLPYESVSDLQQFAFDYIDLDLGGWVTVTFAGDSAAPLVPPPPDGDEFWYAVPANSGRAQLTTTIDLKGRPAANLEFDIWYDLEPAYDHAYVSISLDGGQSWQIIAPVNGVVGSYGPALGGRSSDVPGNRNGWLNQSISLDTSAGHEVMVRFEVITDFEVVGRGVAIAGPRIVTGSDLTTWEPAGFTKVGSALPQPWEVRLIRRGENPEVYSIALDELNRGQILVDLGVQGGTLMIAPVNPFVDSAARYWVAITR